MSHYCNTHHINNCYECAIEKQTKEIIKALNTLVDKKELPPTIWQKFKHRLTKRQ